MNRWCSLLLDVLYPTRAQCLGCGDERGCYEPFLCTECRAMLQPSNVVTAHEAWLAKGLTSVRFVHYYGRPVTGLIRAFKFKGVKMLADMLAQEMADLLKERGIDGVDVIVPVPLHPSRFYKRGYNQSELLADALSEKCGIPVAKDILCRCRKTRQQAKLSHDQRVANLNDAFRAMKELYGMRVLVLDDVITTGSTVSACAEALCMAGAAEVHAISYAGTHYHHRSTSRKLYRRKN